MFLSQKCTKRELSILLRANKKKSGRELVLSAGGGLTRSSGFFFCQLKRGQRVSEPRRRKARRLLEISGREKKEGAVGASWWRPSRQHKNEKFPRLENAEREKGTLWCRPRRLIQSQAQKKPRQRALGNEDGDGRFGGGMLQWRWECGWRTSTEYAYDGYIIVDFY